MNKIMTTILAFSFSMVMVSCGNDNKSSSNSNTNNFTPKISSKSLFSEWSKTDSNGVKTVYDFKGSKIGSNNTVYFSMFNQNSVLMVKCESKNTSFSGSETEGTIIFGVNDNIKVISKHQNFTDQLALAACSSGMALVNFFDKFKKTDKQLSFCKTDRITIKDDCSQLILQ